MRDEHVIHLPAGTVTVPGAVLGQIVARAAERVDGARVRRPRRGLEIQVADGRAHVSLELAVRYGAVLPEVGRSVQTRVRDVLREMCGLETPAVDVSVEELDLP